MNYYNIYVNVLFNNLSRLMLFGSLPKKIKRMHNGHHTGPHRAQNLNQDHGKHVHQESALPPQIFSPQHLKAHYNPHTNYSPSQPSHQYLPNADQSPPATKRGTVRTSKKRIKRHHIQHPHRSGRLHRLTAP